MPKPASTTQPQPSTHNPNLRTYHQRVVHDSSQRVTPQSPAAMKVRILSTTAVAYWHWDTPADDVCGICRVQFDGTCPNCRFPGDDCPLLNGKCGHSFHLHCVNDWIQTESSRGLCPMCRQKFEFEAE